MPEEWREYRACRQFDLSPPEYAATPWQTIEMWFRIAEIEKSAYEFHNPKRRKR